MSGPKSKGQPLSFRITHQSVCLNFYDQFGGMDIRLTQSMPSMCSLSIKIRRPRFEVGALAMSLENDPASGSYLHNLGVVRKGVVLCKVVITPYSH